jgi:hypothetical protein
MHDDDDDPRDDLPQPAPEGLVDHAAIGEIMEKAKDALRPLGLTLQLEGVVIQIQQGHTFAMMPVIVRPSAKEKLTQNKESIEQFNTMMAANNEAKVRSDAERIQKLASDPDALRDFLFEGGELEDECPHLRMHPLDGFCLDCGHGMKDH